MKNHIKLLGFVFFIFFTFSFYSYAQKNTEQDSYPSSAIWKIRTDRVGGTGFFISPNLFVTSFHFFANIPKGFPIDQIILSQETHSRVIHIKNIQKSSALDDLLLLETKESVKDYLTIEGKTPQPSEKLFVIGYPEMTWTKIEKTGKIPPLQDEQIYFIPVNRDYLAGASGAPVLNQKNQVVGVVSKESSNIAFIIQPKKLQKFITKENRNVQTDIYSVNKQEVEKLKELTQKGNAFAQYRLASMYFEYPHQYGLNKSFDLLKKNIEPEYFLMITYRAWIYSRGIGVKQNFKKEFSLHNKLAKQGFVISQYDVAEMYFEGEGVKQNFKQAFYWYQKAAEQGDFEAQYQLAEMYREGVGVNQDFKKAIYWYKKAMNQNNILAQFRLSEMYYTGTGVKQNFKKALGLFLVIESKDDKVKNALVEVSSKQEQSEYPASAIWKIQNGRSKGTGFFISSNLFVTSFHFIRDIPKSFHLNQITLSQETHSRVIHIKNIQALSALDDLLLLETKESVKDYLPLADKVSKKPFIIGYPDGQWAKMEKIGKPSSYYKDPYIYSFPINLNNIRGASGSPVLNQKNQVVGVIFGQFSNMVFIITPKKLKKFITENNKQARVDIYHFVKQEMTHLKSLARKGDSLARYQWGAHNRSSNKKVLKQIFDWLLENVKQEYAPNLFNLATMYYGGIGVKQNFKKAFFFYKKAAEKGFTIAQYNIGIMYSAGIGVEKNPKEASYWLKQVAEQGYFESQKELDKISFQNNSSQCKKAFL